MQQEIYKSHAGPAADLSALSLIEAENARLRSLVGELIEKNQRLRRQLEALTAG
jgi:hypothetical protein